MLGVDCIADFNALHARRHDDEVQFYAFDILSLDGEGLRGLPLSMRKPTARVAIMMPTVLQYPVATCAILRAGFTVVNTNPLYTAHELETQLKDAGAEAIIVLENFAHSLQQAIGKTSIKHVVVASVGDLLGMIKGTIVNLVVRRVKKMVPAYSLPGATPFNAALAAGKTMTLTKPQLGSDDLAFLQYTGGTTGIAKGAMLLHRNVVANMLQIDE